MSVAFYGTLKLYPFTNCSKTPYPSGTWLLYQYAPLDRRGYLVIVVVVAGRGIILVVRPGLLQDWVWNDVYLVRSSGSGITIGIS